MVAEAEIRAAIVAEAMTWLNTPYVHLGDVKGHGVDCAMILVRVYTALGLAPADLDPRPYSPEWYFHRSEEIYLATVSQYARQVDAPQLGDVALYRFGKCVSHGGIVVGDDLLLHAFLPSGRVELIEMRSAAFLDNAGRSRLHSYWSVF